MICDYSTLVKISNGNVPNFGTQNLYVKTWTLYPKDRYYGECVILVRDRINFVAYKVIDVLGTKKDYRHFEFIGLYWEFETGMSLAECINWIRSNNCQ